MGDSTVVTRSFPLFSILGLIFVTLKLLGKIDWSWWWVTAPFWGPWALFFAFMMFIFGGVTLFAIVRHIFQKGSSK